MPQGQPVSKGILDIVWGGQFVRRLILGAGASSESPVSWPVLAFTAFAALGVGIITGIAPALQWMRTDLTGALRSGGRGSHGGFSRTRFLLIGVQAALTVVLLVGTVLFVRSLRRIESVPLGMETSHVLSARINRASAHYSNAQLARDYERLEQAALALPEVETASQAMMTPFSSSMSVDVSLPGRDSVPLTRSGGPYYNAVGAEFFRTLGTRVVGGRPFTAADRAGTSPVLIVNSTLAELWWPGENPIGKCARLGVGDSVPCAQVVGVVEDIRRHAIIEEPSVMLFTPFGQGPAFAQPYVLFIRTRRPAAHVATMVGVRLRAAASGMPFVAVSPLDDLIAPQMQSWKLGALMFALFAVLAIVLASIGLYGVMAYDVAQRTAELGVRMALGAQALDVLRLVLLRGVRIAALGGAAGLALSLAAGARMAPLLFQTSPHDPRAFAIAAIVLGVVTVAATLVPALRAARVDPNTSLRAE
jgi:predicted permease